MPAKNIFYAQSGGPTAVINATAAGVIETARQHAKDIGKVYAGHNGIIGALTENLIDTSLEPEANIKALLHTPGSAFGSCRYKLKPLAESAAEYERLIQVFAAHDIGYFFYNGGNDSQDTTNKIGEISRQLGYPLTVIGLPKTIDNDLPYTDTCPGFGSAAKYIATSITEASLDLKSMSNSSTKVFIFEVMGRHAGWMAAASGLACQESQDPPHIILFPEVPFNPGLFMAKVEQTIAEQGYCSIVVAEGLKYRDGEFLSSADMTDAFGHARLGGTAPVIAHLIKRELGLKYHWAIADYLQRSARHIAAKTDLDQAYAIGAAAVTYALNGINNKMLTIVREQDSPYRWSVGTVELSAVANNERVLPKEFITDDGMHITSSCRDYLAPLIHGECFPPFINGLPYYVKLNNMAVAKKLADTETII